MVEVRKVLNTIALTYGIAIGLTLILGILATALSQAFGEFGTPFITTYNAVRSLTLFMLIMPIALSLILIGFFGDLALSFIVPIFNSIFGLSLPTTIGGQTLMQVVGDSNTGVIGQLVTLINTIFPAL